MACSPAGQVEPRPALPRGGFRARQDPRHHWVPHDGRWAQRQPRANPPAGAGPPAALGTSRRHRNRAGHTASPSHGPRETRSLTRSSWSRGQRTAPRHAPKAEVPTQARGCRSDLTGSRLDVLTRPCRTAMPRQGWRWGRSHTRSLVPPREPRAPDWPHRGPPRDNRRFGGQYSKPE